MIPSRIQRLIDNGFMDTINAPADKGAVLDAADSAWSENILHPNYREYPGSWFTGERKQVGFDLMCCLIDIADTVGIADKMFIGFGTALGYVMYGDFIPNDMDIDFCFLDGIPEQKKNEYYARCCEAGLCTYCHLSPVIMGKRFVWFGAQHVPAKRDGVHCCNAFFFNRDGYAWHGKGREYTGLTEKHSEGVMKGIPIELVEPLKTVSFRGLKTQVPQRIGAYLDWCYPNWNRQGSGDCSRRALLVMGKQADESTWEVVVKPEQGAHYGR